MADNFPSSPSQLEILEGTFNIDSRFSNLRPLCFGGNGIVFSALDKECEKTVAIKKISFSDKKTCKYALREIKIIRRLRHDNIVTVYDILGPDGRGLSTRTSVSLSELTSLYMVQELLDIDLLQLIQSQLLTSDHAQLFLYQMLRGLKYIHSANIVHRDLKPANLLINVEDLVLKIGDFGLARVIDSEYSHKGFLTDGVGTCWYRSPELIISPRDYTKAIDMWSVGCILAEMLTGKPLFTGGNEMDQIGQILDLQALTDNEWNKMTQVLPKSVLRRRSRLPKTTLRSKFKDICPGALSLLEAMLVFNPDRRISADDALSHPYLRKYSCPDDEPEVLHSFHIENEVDELSPKTMRRLIELEVRDSAENCGSFVPKVKNTDKSGTSRRENKNDKNHRSSETPRNNKNTVAELPENSNNINLPDNERNVDNKISEKTTQVEIVDTEGVQESRKPASSLPLSEKELSLKIIVELPDDDENKKEELSPKEQELKEELEPKEEKVKEATDLYEKEQDTAECTKPSYDFIMPYITVTENNKVDCEDTRVYKDLDFILHLDDSIKSRSDIKQGKQQSRRKVKDKLNEEKRAESPRDMVERHNRGNNGHYVRNRSRDRTELVRRKDDRMATNMKGGKNREDSGRGMDFDSMYRLPTEHLLHSRFRRAEAARSSRVENQLNLHEQLNSRLKFEKDKCIGAMGGINIDSNDDGSSFLREDPEPRSRSSSGSSGTEGGNLSDFVPRRFER
ncbi:hypothetical protein FSP39_000784 [Pinctada imbricata]|uniref:Protein kinase domain-containing protein n=1 Tax=Pinctada imbricata TaxID=66713 RepID=A0AA88Y1A3_PINIB|nr:hypothetical protein FSP39_000784 [Pinctada imbricata]